MSGSEPGLIQQWNALLPHVQKPGRYIGGEANTILKEDAQVRIRFALLFPDVYEIGMSHNGFRILYHILNREADVQAERAYAPWPDMGELLLKKDVPILSHETKRAIRDFDMVGISLQAEQSFSNVPYVLKLSQIPVLAKDRRKHDPIVIAGGPCVSNPEPMADFFDVILIGDGEDAIREICEVLRNIERREDRLDALAKIGGIYAPHHMASMPSTTIRRRWVPTLKEEDAPVKPVTPVVNLVHDRVAVEVMRGCTQGCRFCHAGYFYRPVRERSVEEVTRIADKAIDDTGIHNIGLLSLSSADYSQIESLTEEIGHRYRGEHVSVSLPSLRADKLSVKLAENVGEVKKNGFTFAPEAGSERLRRVINKLISNEQMFRAAETAYGNGWNLIKLYFMLGLPTETKEDVDELIEFVRDIGKIARKHGGRKGLTASLGVFVPKAFTPFQWDAFGPAERMEEYQAYCKEKLRSRQIQLRWHNPKEAEVETVLSRGGREVGRAILRAHELGVCFDAWDEHFDYEKWQQAFRETEIDVERIIGRIPFDAPLPWDFVDIEVKKSFLQKERLWAQSERTVVDCKWGTCYNCGVPGNYDEVVLAPHHNARKDKRLPDLVNVEPTRYTLTYEKGEYAKFLSHKNLMMVMDRILARSGIRLRYTEGYSPKIKLRFGPSLPVGMSGSSEKLQFEAYETLADSFVEKLNELTPEGISVKSVKPADPDENIHMPLDSHFHIYPTTSEPLPSELIQRCQEVVQRMQGGDEQATEWKEKYQLTACKLASTMPLDFRFSLSWDHKKNGPARPTDILTELLEVPQPWAQHLNLKRL